MKTSKINNTNNNGTLFIISGPSGVGKTTLRRAIVDRLSNMVFSVSSVTRPKRAKEQDGIDYIFISKKDFQDGIESGKWAEWALVHGNYYGTSSDFIKDNLQKGVDILLDIDVQGAFQIMKKYPDSVSIFIMPPSLEIIEKRIRRRDPNKPADIALRIENAKAEIAEKWRYKHIVINNKLSVAIKEIIAIIKNYRQKREQEKKYLET